MTQIKGKTNDAVSYPYDWVDPQAEYWATYTNKLSKAPDSNWGSQDPGHDWHHQEVAIPMAYEVTPEPGKWYPMAGIPGGYMTYETSRLDTSAWELKHNPWVNGRLAFAALAWGLIIMLLLSIPAGASNLGNKHPGTKVKAIEQREPEPKKACLPPVRVVGSQWATESGAEESAQKAWAEATRFNHGEAYMDLTNAVGYQKRCARSSIGEVVGQTLTRCEVDAAPCRPPFTSGASK